MSHRLHIVAYHYVRDLPNTPFPALKGMLTDDFRRQVDVLRRQYEMATIETALAFLSGTYEPDRDLCLLTFDDGLKEHVTTVAPLLADFGIQGLFFVITACLEEHRVVPVHMSHFLMASLGFARYRAVFLDALAALGERSRPESVDHVQATGTYRWDSPDVAAFKYLVNFGLRPDTRDRVLRTLFHEHLPEEATFADSLYLNWDDARRMEAMGMVIGGHSHGHRPLGLLGHEALVADLGRCGHLLQERLGHLAGRPFCYPYGNAQAYNDDVVATLRNLGYSCAFTTHAGHNDRDADPFRLKRIDCNDVAATP